jgi:hypothetical protein
VQLVHKEPKAQLERKEPLELHQPHQVHKVQLVHKEPKAQLERKEPLEFQTYQVHKVQLVHKEPKEQLELLPLHLAQLAHKAPLAHRPQITQVHLRVL